MDLVVKSQQQMELLGVALKIRGKYGCANSLVERDLPDLSYNSIDLDIETL
jgi:hypothetical protein